MTEAIGDAYTAVAGLYAQLFRDEIHEDAFALKWLDRFAEQVPEEAGPVVDLGCGPGAVVAHLSTLGLDAIGYDVSSGQIEQARAAFPDDDFRPGDLTAIDHDDQSLGGIVARYSIIHQEPSTLGSVFSEWARVLQPGAPMLMSFFGSLERTDHARPFDHKVAVAYELFPAVVCELLDTAGLVVIECGTRPAPPDARPFDQATVLAIAPTG